MSEPAVTRITTKLPFETVRYLLKASCKAPVTIMLGAIEESQEDDKLVINLIFADGEDLTRFRSAFSDPQALLAQKSADPGRS